MINYEILPPLVTNILVLIILFKVLSAKDSKDEYFVNMAILDRIINDYVTLVINTKINHLQISHDLNPESKVNSIKLYETKVNTLIADSVAEIVKLLSNNTKKYLRSKFTNEALYILITNQIKSIL